MMSPSASMAPSPLPTTADAARGKYAAMAMTLAVHVLLLAFLIYGIRWQTQRPEAVEVELVRAVPVPAAAEVVEPQPKPMPPPPPPSEARSAPKVEAKPVAQLPKPDIVLKEEKKKEKPKPPPPVPSAPPPDALQKQLEQELRRASSERKHAEQASAIDKELAGVKAAQAAAARNKATADYMAKIRGRIKSNIILPTDIKGNPEAIFEVTQFPSGEILGVRLKKTSNHLGYDAAVERAILKSSPLPKPDRPDLFDRQLTLTFRPQDD